MVLGLLRGQCDDIARQCFGLSQAGGGKERNRAVFTQRFQSGKRIGRGKGRTI